MELDKEKIKNRFSEMNEALQEIRRLSHLPDNEFWSKKENMAAMKYYLLQTIEATGSVCAHIAAKKFNKGVSSFGECFEVLEKEGILEGNLSVRLKKMVKFRNKLIHRYWEIEDRNILEYARNDIGDFADFMKVVNKLF
ncbi:MAG: DUF86 domain-containing protein [Candidatus Kuenenia sp.]|nr:DUF86 domain-containing protein [Candidatus Kuenenia hertensis]